MPPNTRALPRLPDTTLHRLTQAAILLRDHPLTTTSGKYWTQIQALEVFGAMVWGLDTWLEASITMRMEPRPKTKADGDSDTVQEEAAQRCAQGHKMVADVVAEVRVLMLSWWVCWSGVRCR